MTDQELIQALQMCSKVRCPDCLKEHTVCNRRKWMADASTRLETLLAENKQLCWIPITEQLPESGVRVLFCCEKRSGGAVYKRYVCDGYYAKRYTEQTWNNSGDIACEYREEDDEYYLLEGWYEVINNWDDYNSIAIADFVTHWKPMPEPPKEDSHGK